MADMEWSKIVFPHFILFHSPFKTFKNIKDDGLSLIDL